MVPQSTGAPTYRAVAFARIRGSFSEDHVDTPAMATSIVLAHRRSIPHPTIVHNEVVGRQPAFGIGSWLARRLKWGG